MYWFIYRKDEFSAVHRYCTDTVWQSYSSQATRMWLWYMKTCQTFKNTQEIPGKKIITFWNGKHVGTLIWISAEYHMPATEQRPVNSLYLQNTDVSYSLEQYKTPRTAIIHVSGWFLAAARGVEQRSRLAAGSSVALCCLSCCLKKKKDYLEEEEEEGRRDTVGSKSILTASLNELFFIVNQLRSCFFFCLPFVFQWL